MRLTAAVLAAHLLTTIVTLIVIRDFRFPLHGYPHLPFRIFFAVGFSQLMLVAAWLGSAVTKWRQLSWLLVYVVIAAALFDCMQYIHNRGQYLLESSPMFIFMEIFSELLGTIACALPLLLLCRRRLVLKRSGNTNSVPQLFRPVFSLKLAAIVTTIFAALLALGNEPFGPLLPLLESEHFRQCGGRVVEGAGLAPAVVLACWSIFGCKIRWFGIALCFVLTTLGEVAIEWYLTGGGGTFLQGLFDKFLALVLFLIVLILYRIANVRWTAIEGDLESVASNAE